MYIHIHINIYLYLSLSIYIYIYLYLSLSLSIYIYIIISITISLSISLSLSLYIYIYIRPAYGAAGQLHIRRSDLVRHSHPKGVVYRLFSLNSSTDAVSEIASRRWWCVAGDVKTWLE